MANTLSMKVKLVVAALALAASGDFVNDLAADHAQAQARGGDE